MTYLPLPQSMTLDEAAQAISERLGHHWTAKHVLGCAARGQISVFASLPIDARMVRCEPMEGEPDEKVFQAHSQPRISAATARALLCAPFVDYTEHIQPVALPQRLDQLLACCHADLPRHVVPLPPDHPTGSNLREATGQLG